MTVPASSANLGAGFDSLGLALTLYNRVWMEEADGCLIESTDGLAIPTDESNMIYQTAKGLYDRCGRPFHGLHIRQENNIPMTRGLGSSSACLVAGLLGANTLLGCPLSDEDLSDLAAELEGHPDNTAPALLGGLVTAVMEGGRVYTVSVPVSENIRFAVFIPDFELKTEVARAALPEQVSRADAVYNLSRAALMTASLVLPLGGSLWYGDGAFLGLLSSLVIMVGGGLALAYTNRSQTPLNLTLRDGFAVVGICWIVASFAGGLPFVLTSTASVTDAVFEAASGFTTTGATIFADIEGLPHGLLMWRSLTHWIGGLGIILLSLIVLPLLGVGGMQLYRAEVTGPSPDKLTPRMQDTALTLWRVYCLMTIVLTVLLYIAGMDWFDALNHSFSTVATGGFSTKNNSIAAYPQASIQWILIFFMFIAGINFSLHAQALRGVVKVYLRDRECRFYTVLLILGSAVIVAGLVEHGLFGMRSFPEFEAVTRAAVFQLVSVCTTTGFVSENFNLWPSITLVIILMFMLMGGCAGSTGGGVKVMRLVMLFRLAYLEIFRLLHPHSVRHLKIAGKSVPVEVISGVVGFFLLYLIVTTVGTIVLTVQDMDLVSAFTATLTCISNVGPGLGSVGPVDNFSHVPTLSKWVLTLCMLLGRLELYAILVLFIPEFWRD